MGPTQTALRPFHKCGIAWVLVDFPRTVCSNILLLLALFTPNVNVKLDINARKCVYDG